LPDHAYIEQLSSRVGETVTLRGWLNARRSSGKLLFLELRDGTGYVQCLLFKPEIRTELFQQARRLPQETSLEVTGQVREHQRRPGELEVDVKQLEVIAEPGEEFPISPKEHGVEFLMDHRHLWLRSRRQHAILRVRDRLVTAIRDYFRDRAFTLVDAPVLTPNACEGTSTLFETDYHGDKAYLTQSGQLYMEAAAAALGKVYCFGPTFRAEKSKTRRHLAEFWMVEPEVAFLDLEGDIELAEDFLVAIVARVLEQCREELEILERDVSPLQQVQKPFPRIRYAEAVAMLKQADHPIELGEDLGGDEETLLSARFDRPLVVTHYPLQQKAFYFKRSAGDESLALNMDILAPEGYGEIIGGGQREDDLGTLRAAIESHGLPEEFLCWYLDVRRYGSFPHAGFGLGLERTLGWICGLKHVREASPFPRMLTRLSP
jgi:asparaginyl-tRNA synthetase